MIFSENRCTLFADHAPAALVKFLEVSVPGRVSEIPKRQKRRFPARESGVFFNRDM
jgi:hypothetical protein